MKTKKCPVCPGRMKRDQRDDVVTYKGQTRGIVQPGWYCDRCDETVLEPADSDLTESEFFELKAAVEEVLPPRRVAEIREALGLSQREASKIFGGGPHAFQKYENGSQFVSVPMANLLCMLEQDPGQLKKLQKIRAFFSKIHAATIGRVMGRLGEPSPQPPPVLAKSSARVANSPKVRPAVANHARS